MRTIRIYGEDLRTRLLTTETVDNDILSFAIDILFIENRERQKGKLIMKSKNTLKQKWTNGIVCFTGSILTNDILSPCTGFCYTDDDIEECWLTLIKPETEIFQVNVSKAEFMKKVQEYYKSEGLKHTEDGNLIDGLLFRKLPQLGFPINIIHHEQNITVEIFTEMYNNLFPILREEKGKEEVLFGEYISLYKIKIISVEEAYMRGVTIS